MVSIIINSRHFTAPPTLSPPNLPVGSVGLGGLVRKHEPPVHLVEAALLERLFVRGLAPQLNVVPQKGLIHAAVVKNTLFLVSPSILPKYSSFPNVSTTQKNPNICKSALALPSRVGGLPVLEDDARGHLLPHPVPRDLVESQPILVAL